MKTGETPSQTAGPYLHIGLTPQDRPALGLSTTGLTMSGTIYDGAGMPVTDALIEAWTGEHWTRTTADPATGLWILTTPAPQIFVHLWIAARGINIGLHTRAYLPGASDETLAALSPDEQATLKIQPNTPFDIHLQGPNETVFFDV